MRGPSPGKGEEEVWKQTGQEVSVRRVFSCQKEKKSVKS